VNEPDTPSPSADSAADQAEGTQRQEPPAVPEEPTAAVVEAQTVAADRAESPQAQADPAPQAPAPAEAAADAPGDAPADTSGADDDSPDVPPGVSPDVMPMPEDSQRGRFSLDVRYGALAASGRATTTEANIPQGSAVVVRTDRGTELGLALNKSAPIEGGMGQTVGHVLRVATHEDLDRQRHIEDETEPEELKYCRQKIKERGLRMRLSGIEHLWGNERIIYYFTSERRVDFRALVRDLAWHYHTRIELRQIGARDEARLLADFEHCGRPLCCKTFLNSLEPVTMRMAKLQRTTLDPHKISGRCGRLMCCLRYEDAVYRELQRGLPNRGARVTVGTADAEVLSSDVLSQRVTVRYADGQTAKVLASELLPPEGKRPQKPERPGDDAAGAQSAPGAPQQGQAEQKQTGEATSPPESSETQAGAGQPARGGRDRRGRAQRGGGRPRPEGGEGGDKDLTKRVGRPGEQGRSGRGGRRNRPQRSQRGPQQNQQGPQGQQGAQAAQDQPAQQEQQPPQGQDQQPQQDRQPQQGQQNRPNRQGRGRRSRQSRNRQQKRQQRPNQQGDPGAERQGGGAAERPPSGPSGGPDPQ
jgi:cell fate regulator YaaT (PSP1 superfamily)